MRARVGLLVAIGIALAIVLALRPPIPQWESYHAFADTSSWLGVPNGGNVLSNAPFAIVGVLGLRFLSKHGSRTFASRRELPAYVFFFFGVLLTAFGSGYYHLAPSTPRLFWDRFPMAIAFTALFATVIAERIDVTWARRLLLPLVAAGVGSVVLWRLSEEAGHGDMRVYVYVQAFPMIALPLMMALFEPAYTRSRELLLVVGLYAAAKIFEVLDGQTFALTSRTMSGHSIKHVVAAAATYCVLDMLQKREKRRPS